MEQILLDMLTLYVAEVTGGWGQNVPTLTLNVYTYKDTFLDVLYTQKISLVWLIISEKQRGREGGGGGRGIRPPPLPAPARSEKTKKAWSE